jgi:hypothetical protein
VPELRQAVTKGRLAEWSQSRAFQSFTDVILGLVGFLLEIELSC